MPLFFISDHAFLHLTGLGQKYRYITPGSERVNGMSKFVTELVKATFEDTRPDLVRRRHEEEIAHNRAPSWTGYYPRRQRRLNIPDEALLQYMVIALQLGIIQEEPYAVGGPSRLTTIPTTSLVLEGIGLKWITASYIPFNLNLSKP